MEVPEIDIAELAQLRASDVPLIDVREPHEYVSAHVPGASLVPLATVPDSLGQVPDEGTVYVICAAGGRSRRAGGFMPAKGIDAGHVAGRPTAGGDSGHPVAPGVEP